MIDLEIELAEQKFSFHLRLSKFKIPFFTELWLLSMCTGFCLKFDENLISILEDMLWRNQNELEFDAFNIELKFSVLGAVKWQLIF